MKFENILKRILDKRKLDLCNYWNYNDELEEGLILKILLEEDGLNDVENGLYENSLDYIDEEINQILDEELNEKEKENEELREYLRLELEGNWDLNFKDLIKKSSARLRITLKTNEDGINIPFLKTTKTYKYLKKRFKGYFKIKDLENELNSMMGSNYGEFVFFGEIKGLRILELREEILKGKITLNKNLNCGVFNSWIGAGGDLDLKLKKPITLNLSDWRYNENEKLIKNIENGNKESYYSVGIVLDNKHYGVQETYNLTSECWGEI